MNTGSLKLRMLLAAAMAITIAVLIAGTAFFFTFRRHAENLAARELENDFIQLASGIHIDRDGKIVSRATLSDPRFERPYGGLYWQINEDGQEPLHSRSLWDAELQDPTASNKKVDVITGPNNEALFSIHKQLVLPLANSKDRNLSIILAVDRTDIDAAAANFRRDLEWGFVTLSTALLAGALAQILIGLAPLEALRRNVENIAGGKASNLGYKYPSEIRPLVQSVNDLLAARQGELERARQRASNLAHGLKTPLTVLSAIADNIEFSGNAAAAREVRDNANEINALVDRQLARARLASGHSSNLTELRPVVDRVTNTLNKISPNLNFLNTVPPKAMIAFEATDLVEVLGNLLDNGRKWAKKTVRISFENHILCVEDDGPGVPQDRLPDIETRGFRLDEGVKGSGLGLSIVRDLAEAYGLDVKYDHSSLGGLSVSIGKALALQD